MDEDGWKNMDDEEEEKEVMIKIVSKGSFPTEEELKDLMGTIIKDKSGKEYKITDWVINDEDGMPIE